MSVRVVGTFASCSSVEGLSKAEWRNKLSEKFVIGRLVALVEVFFSRDGQVRGEENPISI
jgi:hypothetical protein